jgi:beta-aspartyl-peptidase (threonine type)
MSGDGEQIIRMTLAKVTIDLLAGDCHPDHAAETAIARFRQTRRGEAGCIVLDRMGRFGWAHNSSHLACAYRNSEMDRAQVALQKREQPHVAA